MPQRIIKKKYQERLAETHYRIYKYENQSFLVSQGVLILVFYQEQCFVASAVNHTAGRYGK